MKSLKGSLLIASPALLDPNFLRTVVFLADHDQKGALGFILNRPSEVPVSKIWSSLTEESVELKTPAFFGGPVQHDALFFLHGHDELAAGIKPVVQGVYLGQEVQTLGALIERAVQAGADAPARFRVFSGYAGWGAGQLEHEVKEGSWVVLPAQASHIFESEPLSLWSETMRAKGGIHALLSLMPLRPELN